MCLPGHRVVFLKAQDCWDTNLSGWTIPELPSKKKKKMVRLQPGTWRATGRRSWRPRGSRVPCLHSRPLQPPHQPLLHLLNLYQLLFGSGLTLPCRWWDPWLNHWGRIFIIALFTHLPWGSLQNILATSWAEKSDFCFWFPVPCLWCRNHVILASYFISLNTIYEIGIVINSLIVFL